MDGKLVTRTVVGARQRTAAHACGRQAAPEQYLDPGYLSPERLSSIGHQYRLAIQSRGNSFLNVGSAHGLLELMLSRAGYLVAGLDLSHSFHPSIVGALPSLPLRDKCVDVAMAFQVLEHIPFEMLEACLTALRRVSRTTVIISLPDRTPFWQSGPTSSRLEALAARFHRWAWARQAWRFETAVMTDPQHFWEIGHGCVTSETIVSVARSSGLVQRDTFRNPCFAYHTYFIFDVAV